MDITDSVGCTELLLDLIYYELVRGRLSSEMEYLFERHLEQCPNCRRRILGFHHILHETEIVRNYG
jgi:hypothetical protein